MHVMLGQRKDDLFIHQSLASWFAFKSVGKSERVVHVLFDPFSRSDTKAISRPFHVE